MEIINSIYLMYGKYLPVVYALILLNWFYAKEKIDWQLKDYLIPLIAPPLWLGLFYVIAHSSLNRGKGLANLWIEPIFLGIGVGVVYIISSILSPSGSALKGNILVIGVLIVILTITVLFPVLSGDM